MGVRELKKLGVAVVALAAVLIGAAAISPPPAPAATASPVLEFVAPSFPVPFTAAGGEVTAVLEDFDTTVQCTGSAGEGQLTGPRTALSHYVFSGCETQGGADGGRECKSEGAAPNEIRSGQIEAELVFLAQLPPQVGMLLAPHGGVYLSFECGGEAVNAIGPFLSPVGPINQVASSFTATLSRVGSTQTPQAYDDAAGVPHAAIPTGERGGMAPVPTGVELGFTIRTAVPVEVRAMGIAEVTAQQRADELFAEAEAKRRAEAASKAAAEKKAQEEEAAAVKREHEVAQARERARHRAKALRQCRKLKHSRKRIRCETRAKKKYGPPTAAPYSLPN